MLSVLFVEDDAEKRQRVTRALAAVDGVSLEGVDHAPDIFSAKRFLSERAYDLLILDIALPMSSDQDAQPDAGIRLLDELTSGSSRYRVPAHIIGITGYPDIYMREGGRFSSRLLTLVQYDQASSEWEQSLQARVRHILGAASSKAEVVEAYQSHLAVLCALESPELASVLALPWDWKQVLIPGDHTIYWRGSYKHAGGIRVVHAAASSRKGMPAAAVCATKMIHAFRPKFLGMTGITAGIRDRVQMGDVIVADPSWDWGSGKWILQGDVPRFNAAPHQLPLAVDIRSKFKQIARDVAFLAKVKSEWLAERPASELSIRVGPSASGAAVLADRSTAEKILAQHRELLGIEMEAYGVFAAAEEATAPRPLAFALKSVVDFADGEKNDRYQPYGAYVSARILQHLAEQYLG